MDVTDAFSGLGTAQIADACVRLGTPIRTAPPGLRAVRRGDRVGGRVLPVRHHGSVDVFLEVLESAARGDVLVIDNEARPDEGCIGDLIVLEAEAAGLAGIIVWGSHRDTAQLLQIGLPVFSYGASSAGPVRLDPTSADTMTSARIGDVLVTRDDVVFADGDGAIFVSMSEAAPVLDVARDIAGTEAAQTALLRGGTSLRDQLQFSEYLEQRDTDPDLTFRQHLRSIDGAVEE